MINNITLNKHDLNPGEINRQDIGWNEFSRERNTLLCDVNFRRGPFEKSNAQVHLQAAYKDFYNGYDFYNLYANGDSSIQVTTSLDFDSSKTYYLNLDHCSTLVGGVPSAEVNIYVNGTKVLSRFNPQNGGNFRQQHFDVTPYLVNGSNHIEIQLDDRSVSQYWISSLCLYAK